MHDGALLSTAETCFGIQHAEVLLHKSCLSLPIHDLSLITTGSVPRRQFYISMRPFCLLVLSLKIS